MLCIERIDHDDAPLGPPPIRGRTEKGSSSRMVLLPPPAAANRVPGGAIVAARRTRGVFGERADQTGQQNIMGIYEPKAGQNSALASEALLLEYTRTLF
jgi:hypothetical protein